jgi:hypothetical protein
VAKVSLSSLYSFVSCWVQSRDVLRVLAQSDQLNSTNNANTTLLKFLPKQNQEFSYHLQWTATKIVAVEQPAVQVIAAGPYGQVNVGTAAGDTTEQIGTKQVGPSTHGLMSDLRLIGRTVFAAGMRRQVYERTSAGTWVPVHGTMLHQPSTKEVRGFNALHGLTESEIAAAGWYGEIYRRRGTTWSREDSGTNVILNDIHIAPNGTTYACGQKGTLLQNSGSGWELIEQEEMEDEIRSLQWFGDRLYLSTDEQLFSMDRKGSIKAVKVTTAEATFNALHAADGVLLSVGNKDIWWTTDAKKWHRID